MPARTETSTPRPARLLTTAGITNDREAADRALEAVLAVVAIVGPFADALLGQAGVRSSASAVRETFVGAEIGSGSRRTVAPGVIEITKGRSMWRAAVIAAVKDGAPKSADVLALRGVGTSELSAVLVLANEPAATSNRRGSVPVLQLTWAEVAAAITATKRVSDREQALVLAELGAYIADPDARLVVGGDMGPSWTSVRDAARRSRVSARDAGVRDVARRWDDVVRRAAAKIATISGSDVDHVFRRRRREIPNAGSTRSPKAWPRRANWTGSCGSTALPATSGSSPIWAVLAWSACWLRRRRTLAPVRPRDGCKTGSPTRRMMWWSRPGRSPVAQRPPQPRSTTSVGGGPISPTPGVGT